MPKERYYLPTLSESDRSEVLRMIEKSKDYTQFVQQYRRRYGFIPHVLAKSKLSEHQQRSERKLDSVEIPWSPVAKLG